MSLTTTPSSSVDPIKRLLAILTTKDLDNDSKIYLIKFAENRFKHRRRMAYIALAFVIFSLVAIFAIPFFCKAETVAEFQKVENIIIWIDGFLMSIVGAYYGLSSFKPSS